MPHPGANHDTPAPPRRRVVQADVVEPPATISTAKFLEKIQGHCSVPAHDYFARSHSDTMASQLMPPDADRPSAPSRARTAVENLLPAGIVRRASGRPPATPHMERSVSSMADSFADYWGVCARNPDFDGSTTPDPAAAKDDGLTPISNWAHLNYMKSQRNTLRAELKAHQIAGAEAKRSVASLRRLAFRMAVNISVKERQIATSARNLANSRKSSYMDSKDAEKRVEALKRALRVEEGRNREILEALERASMLTLQYADPTEAQHRRSRNPISPPPSPTNRLSQLSMTTLSGPQTPPRSTSSSWNETDWELTPVIDSPTEVRTSDSRLIRAKRESDQALAACRRRINELQAESAKTKEDGKVLEASKTKLEKDIQEQRSRITSLEEARDAIEETLKSTQLQLEVSTDLETGLKQKLRLKNKELSTWEQSGEASKEQITALGKEKEKLTAQLKERDSQFQDLESRTTALQENLKALEEKLNTAGREEALLHEQLNEKENTNEDLKKRLERGSKYEQILQKKIAEHEQEILGNVKKINIGGGLISSLREQVKQSEGSKKDVEQALTTLRTELTNLDAARIKDVQDRDRIAADLSSVQSAKTEIEDRLRSTEHDLAKEKAERSRLQSEMDALRSSSGELRASLQAAQRHIQSLERTDDEREADLELLRDEKASIEADLRDARQTIFSLREAERISKSEMNELRSTVKNLEQKLRESKERESTLESQLKQAREARAAADQYREEESRSHSEQHHELKLSMASLTASLEASEKLKASLREELAQFQSSNKNLEDQLTDSLRTKTGLESELDTVRSNLKQITDESNDLKSKVTDLEADLEARERARSDTEARLTHVHNERESIKQRVTELQSALQDSHDATSKAEESLRAHQESGESSAAEVTTLRDQLQAVEASKQEIESRLSEIATARSDLENQLQTAQSRLAETESEASKVKSELSALHDETTQIRHAKVEAEEQLQTSHHAHDELKDQLQSTQSRLQTVDAEMVELKSQLTTSHDELEATRHGKAEVESKLKAALKAHAEIEEQLSIARQGETDAQALESELVAARVRLTELENANAEVDTLRQGKSEVEGKLSEALASTSKLEQDLQSTRGQLSDFETKHAALTERMSSTDDELANIRGQAEDSSTIRARLEDLESEKASMVTEAAQTKQAISDLNDKNTRLEEELRNATQRTTQLENDLQAACASVETAESEGVALKSKIVEANKDIDTLREANAKLTDSEKEHIERLKSAEEDLQNVRDTNKRLEAFLERVEQDMAHAETAFEESEKRLEEFVEESESKLEAARNAKLKYKRRLSDRNNEIGTLTTRNTDLDHQMAEMAQEISALAKEKEELNAQLSEKDKFVTELRASSDKRMRSMNTAYNELRSRYQEQLGGHGAPTKRPQRDRAMTDNQPRRKDEMSSSYAALEREVEGLREDKKAFEQLVTTLQEKIRHLQVLEEWQEEENAPSRAGPSRAGVSSIPSTPTTQHSRSSRPSSLLSHPSAGHERPTTGASTASKQEDLQAWASEIERIRMLRNEQAIQLRNNKQARHDLKKSLKESKSQLHQLEKHKSHTPTRPRAYLRKSRPSTANMLESPTIPDRPATSHDLMRSDIPHPNRTDTPFNSMRSRSGTPFTPDTARSSTPFTPGTARSGTPFNNSARSRHTIHFSPDMSDRPKTSTPRPQTPLRWSTLTRPKSRQRPVTSGGLEEADERPQTSGSATGGKEKRRWSAGLRKLFK